MQLGILAIIAIVTGFGIYRLVQDAYQVKDEAVQDPEVIRDELKYGVASNSLDAAAEGILPRLGVAIARAFEAIAHHFHV